MWPTMPATGASGGMPNSRRTAAPPPPRKTSQSMPSWMVRSRRAFTRRARQ
jgi:hypothetical protein